MSKIEKLTPEQEASLIPFREQWRAIGLSTEPTHKIDTIETITQMYKLLGRKQPLFIFCPSPLFCIQQINFFKLLGNDWQKLVTQEANLRDNLWDNLGDNLMDNLWANLRDNLGANLMGNLRANLWDNLGDNLGDDLGANLMDNLRANLWDNLGDNLGADLGANLWADLGDNLWDNLGDNLWDNLWANLGDNLGADLGANLWDNRQLDSQAMRQLHAWHSLWTYGQMDSYWIAFYQFTETIGIKYDKKDSELLELWAKVAKSCSWFWCFENVVFVSDRPKALHFNKEWRLHNEHGAAYEFRDGWKAFYLNGVKFPQEMYIKVISREMEMKEIMAIEDIDQRTQAMKFAKNGLREFYKSENGKCIDHYVKLNVDGDPIKYELWELQGNEVFTKKVWFMIYDCPSSVRRGDTREYSKGVPEFKTVAEAMAWGMSDDTHRITPEHWKQLTPLIHES